MAFCSFCGRQLNDGEVCSCRQQPQTTTDQTVQPGQAQGTASEQQVQFQQTQFQQSFQPEGAFSPTMPPVKKNLNLGIIIGAVAGVALIAVIILIVMMNRPKTKLYKAITKTFEDSGELVKTLGKIDYTGKAMSVDVSGEFEGIEAAVTFAYDGKEKEISGKIGGKKMDEIAAVLQLVKGKVKLAFPGTDYDKVIVYNYKDGSNEFLEDQLGSNTLEELNTALDMLYEASPSGNDAKELTKIAKDWYGRLEIKKIEDKKKFKVDSEKRECGGYIIVVKPQDLIDLINRYVDWFEKNYSDMLDQAGIDDLRDNLGIDRLEDQVEDAENLEVACYLYSGKLAGIVISTEEEDNEFRINFEGGDYRMQNLSAEIVDDDDKEELFSISGKTSGSKESGKIKIENAVIEWSYDKSSGDIKISANEDSSWGSYELFSMKGNLQVKGSTLTFTIKDVSSDGRNVDLDDLTISISSSAKLTKLKGSEFDFSEADEDDIEDELEELQDAFGDLANMLRYLY